ncbi:MAG: hypothetical protein FWC03_08105 [Treponema sp.]|nr:hypothetical protein [Treponema sp.]
MIGFFIRKSFYDLWDNMFRIVLLNLGFIALAAIPILVPRLISLFIDSQALEIIFVALGILLCSVYLSTASYTIKSISDYGSFGFSDFIRNIKKAWSAGLVMGFFVFLLFIILFVVMPFYMGFESILGLVLGAVVFWTMVFGLLSCQYYFSVCARLINQTDSDGTPINDKTLSGRNLIKAFKKCMLVLLDNSGFSFFLMLHNIVVLLISVVLAFLFPGPAGILLYADEALRLRLLKYDWLEANPDADRRKIPWDALLIEEREKTGTRTFKNFIFPWKD